MIHREMSETKPLKREEQTGQNPKFFLYNWIESSRPIL